MKDLELLPVTQITASSGKSMVQIRIENDGENLTAVLTGQLGDASIGPIEKGIPSSAGTLIKAGVIGGLLGTGLERLAPSQSNHPEGLPVEFYVRDGNREVRRKANLKLNLSAMQKLQWVIGHVRGMNAKVEETR